MNTIEWRQEQLQKRKRSEALDKIALKRTQEIIRDLQKPSGYRYVRDILGDYQRLYFGTLNHR